VRHMIFISGILSVLLLSGCFEHREAPERLMSAVGIEAARQMRATVQKVDLGGAKLDRLPEELAEMPRLECLLLRGAEAADFGVLPRITALRMLDLAAMRLAQVPEEVTRLANLQMLYLSDNALTNLPPALGMLGSLTYLNLDRNRLAVLPQTLGDLRALRWLRLNQNQLAALPEAVGSLAQLQRLYLRDNRLRALPEALAGCALIEDLALSGNQLDAFPELLTRLPRLRNLDLSGNPLATFPEDEALARMSALRLLTLTRCNVRPEMRERLRAALPKCLIAF